MNENFETATTEESPKEAIQRIREESDAKIAEIRIRKAAEKAAAEKEGEKIPSYEKAAKEHIAREQEEISEKYRLEATLLPQLELVAQSSKEFADQPVFLMANGKELTFQSPEQADAPLIVHASPKIRELKSRLMEVEGDIADIDAKKSGWFSGIAGVFNKLTGKTAEQVETKAKLEERQIKLRTQIQGELQEMNTKETAMSNILRPLDTLLEQARQNGKKIDLRSGYKTLTDCLNHIQEQLEKAQ